MSQTKGSIGYVEYAYALQNKLVYTKMINKDGKTVAPTSAAFQAAAANADWNSVPGYGVILANQPVPSLWPMTAATLILIHKQPDDPAAAAAALKFFAWAYTKGDKMAEELDYVPMPKKVVGEIEKMWASQIKDSGGKALYTAADGSLVRCNTLRSSNCPACCLCITGSPHDALVRRPVDCLSRRSGSPDGRASKEPWRGGDPW